MINLLKNKFDRILQKKEIIIIAFVVVPLMIGIAILFTGKRRLETIAFVTEQSENIPQDSRYIVKKVKERPKDSELMVGKYAFIVEKNGNRYEVTTLKNKTEQEAIESLFQFGSIPEGYKSEDELFNERGVGTNILGFLLMIILMQGVALTTFFPEDRHLKSFRRILTSPVSEGTYFLSQGVFTFLALYIPSFLAIAAVKILFRVNIGFNFGNLAILLAVLTFLATAFAIFMASVMERNINLVTSAISMITCVLAGSFTTIRGGNKIFNFMSGLLPQKSYMTIIYNIERGQGYEMMAGELIYIFIWSAAFCFIGIFITKDRMKRGIY